MQEIELVVNRIMEMKANNIEVDTSQQEKQIDQLVYQLYKITPEEIAIIEGKSDFFQVMTWTENKRQTKARPTMG